MLRQSLRIALASLVWLTASNVSLTGEIRSKFANEFPGRWSLQSAYSAPCNDCAVGIVRSGSILLVMTNMGWVGVLDIQTARFASGQAVTTNGRPLHFKVEMAVRTNALLISTSANDGSIGAPNLIATFERQNKEAEPETEL